MRDDKPVCCLGDRVVSCSVTQLGAWSVLGDDFFFRERGVGGGGFRYI